MTSRSFSRSWAQRKDRENPLRHFREQFEIPTRRDLTQTTLLDRQSSSISNDSHNTEGNEPCVYLCGNSLGLKPKCVDEYLRAHLTAWGTKAVTGHFSGFSDSPLPPFVELDQVAAREMAKLVGAGENEVAVMGSLTANLHLLMASFYRPQQRGRYKIILEGKAFPSDHVSLFILPTYLLSSLALFIYIYI